MNIDRIINIACMMLAVILLCLSVLLHSQSIQLANITDHLIAAEDVVKLYEDAAIKGEHTDEIGLQFWLGYRAALRDLQNSK